MSQPSVMPEPREPFKLNVRGVIVTDEQFELLCQENPELRLELTAQKELVIMPPTGYETGRRNLRLGRYLDVWAEADGTGTATDSSTLFILPNGAKRSPDAAWVRQERVDTIPKDRREAPLPLCPDFVIELRSPTDRIIDVQEKMQEYLDNGALLGLLLDPFEKRVYIYRPGQPAEVLDDPETVSGEAVLPGFVLHVRELW